MKTTRAITKRFNDLRSRIAVGAGALILPVMMALPGKSLSQEYASTNNAPPTEAATAKATHSRSDTKVVTTDPTNNEPFVMYDDVTDAQDVSLYRDGIWAKGKEKDPYYVGVYMIVDRECAVSADELIPGVKSYFDHYELPVKFVKQLNPFSGKTASIVVYVNGVAYEGDLSNGNLSLVELRDNHQRIFSELRPMYEAANSPATSMTLEQR